ncbi:MAG: aldehyde dehydrogenase family protein [Ectothiorhodospiraceae bacterium]|nr:aldehyde dehydrogenase family protein [Ectothiorhodospiraceae bacterium]
MIGPQLGFTPRGLYIGGEWSEAVDGSRMETTNPSTGEHLGEVPLAGEADVDRAVRAARAAFERDWGRMPARERAGHLEALADRLHAHRDELGLMDCVDSGNALAGMVGDVDWTVETLRYFAGLVTEIKGETSSQGARHMNFTRRQPYGVVAKINPFNHPFRFCAEKAAAALAAGNTVVVKGPEQAPLSSLRFAELCEGVMPPGVINVVTGGGATGSAMVRHPLVERIGFVGSVETGRIIAREAAEGLKEVTLELGGKNPIIIFPDADPAKAAKAAVKGMNMNRQGQSCSSTSRVFVHESLHDAVVEALVAEVEALPVGFPWLADKEVGPIVSKRQLDRVMEFVDAGRREGARLLTGGGPPDDPELANGHFLAPTVFDAVDDSMRIAREEIFGPVMSVLTWSDYEAMLERANGLVYGLTASIVTNDLDRAMETADRVEAGYVWINSSGRYLGAPYGGWKHSGIGREECFEELMSYTRVKNVNLRW